jgi:hypothetical protein
MRKNVIILLLVVFTLTLLIVSIQQRRQLRSLVSRDTSDEKRTDYEETIHQFSSRLEKERRLAAEVKAYYEETIRQLRSKLERERSAAKEAQANYEKVIQQSRSQSEMTKAMSNAPEAEPTPDRESSTPQPDNESPMSGIVEMIKQPGMKEMIRTQQKAQIETSHGSLFEELDLPDADMESFKELLLKKQMALVDVGLEMMDASTTTDKRREIKNRIKELTAEYDKEIEAFLGEEDFALYKEYEETRPERMLVNHLKQSLSDADKLEQQQEENLIWAMHEARSTSKFTKDYEEWEKNDPTQYSPEFIAGWLERTKRLHEQYLMRAGEILTPEQLNQLKTSLEQQRSMREMAMKIAAQMFKKPRAEAKPSDGNSE